MIGSRKKASLISLISNYANTAFLMVTGLFLLPLYLNYFSMETYGSWLASGNLVGIFGILQGGIHTVFAQSASYTFGKGEPGEYVKIVGAGLVVTIIVSMLISICILFSADYIISSLKISSFNKDLIIYAFKISGIAASINIICSFMIYVFGSWQQNTKPALISFLANTGGIISTVLSLVIFNQGIVSLAIGMFTRAIISLTMLGILLCFGWRRMNLPILTFNRKPLTQLIRKSLPLMAANTMGVLVNNSREALFAWLINPEATAIVSITGKVYSLGQTVLNPIGASLFQGLASIKSEIAKFKQITLKFDDIHLFLSLIFFPLLMIINHRFVSIWVGESRYGGEVLSALLSITAFFQVRANFVINMLYADGKFNPVAMLSVYDVSIRAILIYLLFYGFHINGMQYIPIIEIFSVFVSFSILYIIFLKNTGAYPLNTKNLLANIYFPVVSFYLAAWVLVFAKKIVPILNSMMIFEISSVIVFLCLALLWIRVFRPYYINSSISRLKLIFMKRNYTKQ